MKKLILVEPETPENTGFIARLAENFNADLRIVNPEFNLSKARKTANTSQQKLRDAKIFETVKGAVEDLDYVAGTKPGKGTPLNKFEPPENTSLMIGRESSGLSNKELQHCDTVIHIKTGEKSSISQSHATAILLHHTYTQEKNTKTQDLQKLDTITQQTGKTTKKLLKRAAPTPKEIKAAISEIKNSNQ